MEIDMTTVLLNIAREYGVEYAFDGCHKIFTKKKDKELWCKDIENPDKEFQVSSRDMNVISAITCLFKYQPHDNQNYTIGSITS